MAAGLAVSCWAAAGEAGRLRHLMKKRPELYLPPRRLLEPREERDLPSPATRLAFVVGGVLVALAYGLVLQRYAA